MSKNDPRFERRPLRWTEHSADQVCLVDDLWHGREILLPKTITHGASVVELTADKTYLVDGWQDDVVIRFDQFLLHVMEGDNSQFGVISLTIEKTASP